jgi:hypothetical protein
VGGIAAAAAAAPQISMEEQAMLMELNREAHKDDPTYPPLPPTILTPGLKAAQEEDEAAAAGANASSGLRAPPSLPIPGRPPGFPSL